MKDIKSIVAKNISSLRQAQKMTQLELAEQLNYSDKAVSKWERGESLPDISVLIEIAELFGVSLDYLVSSEHRAEDIKMPKKKPVFEYSKEIITALSILLVWLIAVLVFVVLSLVDGGYEHQWLVFVVSVPVSILVWLILNTIWLNRAHNYLIVSLLMWSVLIAMHVMFIVFSIDISLVYLLGIPGQIIIILWSKIKKRTKKDKK